jgi:hypothetical protein
MRKYAVIPIDFYIAEDLTSSYPVNSEVGAFQVLEYVNEPDPIGEHWVIFTGEDANVKCYEYLEQF